MPTPVLRRQLDSMSLMTAELQMNQGARIELQSMKVDTSPFSFSPLLPSTQSSLIMHLFVRSGQSNCVRFLSEYINFSVFVMVLSLLNHNKSRRVHVFSAKCNACFPHIPLIHSLTNILLLNVPCFDAYQSTNSLNCLDHVIPVSYQVCSCVM